MKQLLFGPGLACRSEGALKKGLLVQAIRAVDFKEVIAQLSCQSQEAMSDIEFIRQEILPLLFDQNSFVRGLAFFAILESGEICKKDPVVLQACKKSALDLSLSDVLRKRNDACRAFVREMGNYDYKDGQNCFSVSAALAILDKGAVSPPVKREKLDEYYFIISGVLDVWLCQPPAGGTVTRLLPGDSIFLPRGASVQFKNPAQEKVILFVPTNPPYDRIAKEYGRVETLVDAPGCF